MKQLLWKEWRETRFLFAAFIAMGMALIAGREIALRFFGLLSYTADLLAIIPRFVIPFFFAACLGGRAFAEERAQETLGLLLRLPLKKSQIWWAKVIVGMLEIFALFIILHLLVAVVADDPKPFSSFFVACLLVMLFILPVTFASALYVSRFSANSILAMLIGCIPISVLFVVFTFGGYDLSETVRVIFTFGIILLVPSIFLASFISITRVRISRESARKLFLRFCVVLGCIVGAYFLLRGSLYAIYSLKVKKEIALFIAEGGATHIRDLAPEPIPEREENPARYLEAAFLIRQSLTVREGAILASYKPKGGATSTHTPSVTEVDFTDPDAPEQWKVIKAYREFCTWVGENLRAEDKPWNDEWLPFLEKYCAENEIPLTLIREGASLGWGGFEIDWNVPIMTIRFPHLEKLRDAARLLSLEAVLLARKGDIAGAMEDVRLIFRLRRFIDDEPTLISKLVAYALDSIACSALKGVLMFGSPDWPDVENLLEELKGREERNRLDKAFLATTTFGIQYFEEIRKGSENYWKMMSLSQPEERKVSIHPLRRLGFWVIWIRPMDEYCYLRFMRKQREMASQGLSESAEDWRTNGALFEEMARPQWLYPVTNMITPALGRALVAEARLN